MKIVYLPSARSGLAWMRSYYRAVFPAGGERAKRQFHAIELTLNDHPHAGHPTSAAGVRKLLIPNTPLSVVYRVVAQRIEVLEIRDERSRPTDEGGAA